MTANHPLVEMRGIRKSFGSTEVLHGVDFDVLPGEVHVLAGENGAGKSTLIKILSGAHAHFTGEMLVAGHQCRFSYPSQAVDAGIATIHQELSLVPTLSISDNLFLGQERRGAFGQVDFPLQEAEAARVLQETGLDLSPHQPVSDLSMAAQQTLEIARALARDALVVVFDEPTSALGEQEAEALFQRILELRGRGRGVVYITHKMEEIYRLADRITVLRDGEMVRTAAATELPPEELVRLMVGRDLPGRGLRPGQASGSADTGPVPGGVGPEMDHGGGPKSQSLIEVALEVEGLTVSHPRIPTLSVVDDVSLTLRRGEIVGLAGLEGSGKSEVLHALFGALENRASGKATLSEKPLLLRNPRASVERGLILLTNDRKAMGLAPEMGVTQTVSLSSLNRFSNQVGWMDQAKEQAAVRKITSDFRLYSPSLDAPVRVLSGGNQQKAYLARCLLPDPRVLLLDEPTRGIDVGAKADIYELMAGWVREGIGILLITSEMDELLALCDRILVMFRGRVTAEFTRETATKDLILTAAMGNKGIGNQRQAKEIEGAEWTHLQP